MSFKNLITNNFSKWLFKREKEKCILAIPSLSISPDSIQGIVGIEYYELRCIWKVLYTLEDDQEVIFVSSLPPSHELLNQFKSINKNFESKLNNVTFITIKSQNNCLNLCKRINNNQSLISLLQKKINGKKAKLFPFITSIDEIELSKKLKIPLVGGRSLNTFIKSKSGNKKVFTKCHIPTPRGFENIYSVKKLVGKIERLILQYPSVKKYMVKLNAGVSGNGNALLTLDHNEIIFKKWNKKQRRKFILNRLLRMNFLASFMDWYSFKEEIIFGCIVEEFIDGQNISSPSGQGFIGFDGQVEVLSTHEQLFGECGQSFKGCIFPANKEFRELIHIYVNSIGKYLYKKGVNGFFAVDFLAYSENESRKMKAIEINIREGGTTHPYQLCKRLLDLNFDIKDGVLKNKDGRSHCYLSNDNFQDTRLSQSNIKDFYQYMTKKNLIVSTEKGEGVIFHLLDAIPLYGKIGYTIVSSTTDGCQKIELILKNEIENFIRNQSQVQKISS